MSCKAWIYSLTSLYYQEEFIKRTHHTLKLNSCLSRSWRIWYSDVLTKPCWCTGSMPNAGKPLRNIIKEITILQKITTMLWGDVQTTFLFLAVALLASMVKTKFFWTRYILRPWRENDSPARLCTSCSCATVMWTIATGLKMQCTMNDVHIIHSYKLAQQFKCLESVRCIITFLNNL